MVRLKRLSVILALVAATLVVMVSGCSKFSPGDPNPNIPPETTLSFSPDEGDTANYRVRMNWFGWDPDGEIAYFWTRWDTSEWMRVVSTDSVFLVSSYADFIDTLRGYEHHSFWVKAVDNMGAVDATPDSVTFTAFTMVPDTRIERGPSGITGPMVTFEWAGTDRDGVIVGFGYTLYRIEGNLEIPVASNDSLSAEQTSQIFGPLAGKHKFEVWAKDDAGAVDQTPASRSFTCNPELAGPKLYVLTNVFGVLTFRGPIWPESINTPIPIFAGERLAFRWIATAQSYGGEIVGYRHAYDDTSTWPAWSAFDSRFEVIPEVGKHSLYVGAIDNANEVTRARVYFDVIQASLDDYIGIVDDWDLKENLVAWGTDEMRDAFYDSLLVGYTRPRFQWEPSEHLESGQPQPPDVSWLSGASTVIWYADLDGTTLERLFDPFMTTYNSLSGYVRVGGNLILAGDKVFEQIVGEMYGNPNVYEDEFSISSTDTTPAITFYRDFLHIGSVDYSGESTNTWNYGKCLHCAVPTGVPGFETMCVDTLHTDGSRAKWPLYNSPIPIFRHCGLPVESVGSFQGTGLEIYKIRSFKNVVFHDRTCSVMYLSGDNHSNACYFGFPLYYIKTKDVRPTIDHVLSLFGEEKL